MIRKTIAGLTAAAALAAPLALAAPASADSEKTIADVLLSDEQPGVLNSFDKNWYDFDIVTQAVLLYPDLVAAASDPEANRDKGGLTVFAPNDRAFQVLVWDLTKKWPRTEQAAFDAVASLGLETVKTVLTYHIVPAGIPSSAALDADGAKLPTLQGQTIKVDVISKKAKLIRLKDKDKNDLNPWIVRSKFDVGGTLSNGYIHGISLVLRPTNL
jgi:uncharacterized surface protein with fasciclin (FAS1) repeats